MNVTFVFVPQPEGTIALLLLQERGQDVLMCALA